MSEVLEDGCTLLDHLKVLAKQGDVESQLRVEAATRAPVQGVYLWTAYLDMAATRGSTGFGPAPITRHDIHAWEEDSFVSLDPWERRTVLAIDRAYLEISAKRAKPQTKQKTE